ncbi:MAG: tetratricopeptide repeat protein, partial [Methanobacteriota archaeon]
MIKKLGLCTILFICVLAVSSIIPTHATEVRHDNSGAIELYNKAVDKTALGDFEEAVNLTDEALSIQPNFTLALVTRSSALLALGRFEMAKESLDAARALEPDDPSVLATAAAYSLRIGEYLNAIRYADQSLASDPTIIEAWIIKGTAHGNLGEYQEELNASKQALLIAPDNQLAKSNLQYSSDMIKKGKKTPLSFSSVMLALMCGIILIY